MTCSCIPPFYDADCRRAGLCFGRLTGSQDPVSVHGTTDKEAVVATVAAQDENLRLHTAAIGDALFVACKQVADRNPDARDEIFVERLETDGQYVTVYVGVSNIKTEIVEVDTTPFLA